MTIERESRELRRAIQKEEERTWELELPGRRLPGGADRAGARSARARRETDVFSDLVSVRTEVGYRFDGLGRGDDRHETLTELDGRPISGHTPVELDLGEGVRWWTTVGELAVRVAMGEETRSGEGSAAVERSAGDGPARLRVPRSLAGGGEDRGWGRLALQGLRFLGVTFADDLVDAAGRASARRVAEALEGRLQPGLRFAPDPAELGDEVVDSGELKRSGHLLVFLHGTASNSSASFGDLGRAGTASGTWKELLEDYGDTGVLAFDHRTLTESPIQNAVDLLRRLPADARLHLVSHSRGGLVGELLCHGALADGGAGFDENDLRPFTELGRDEDLRALRELDGLLRDKRPRVDRFVRVACPAAGTHLMSDRLDQAFSMLLNLLGWVPGLAQSDTYYFVKSFLLALLDSRQGAEDFPGLEAMMPRAPLVAMLARSPERIRSELAVLSGDLEGAPRLARLAEFGLDRLFREDHDLVVHTESMRRGSPRVAGQAFDWTKKDSTTHHFSYFENRGRSIPRILRRGPAVLEEFRPLAMDSASQRGRGILRSAAEVHGERPVAVVLPGIMGSRLAVGGDVIWLDKDDILQGGIRKLGTEADGVQAVGLLERGYGDFVEFLGRSHEVMELPYDWRLSVREAARRLLSLLEDLLDRTDQPIRLVAHSMGGVVSLASRLPGLGGEAVWNRLAQRAGFRLLMLGVPSRGSHVIPAIVFAREKMVKMLHSFSFGVSRREVLEIVGQYQGIFDLLPSYGTDQVFEPDSWKKWQDWDLGEEVDPDERWPVPGQKHLDAAKTLRDQLDASLHTLVRDLGEDGVVYVAGRAEQTPNGIRERSATFWRKSRLELVCTDQGDGRVTWDSGPPPGVRTYYVEAKHGAIPGHQPSHPGYVELLETGSTRLLRASQPASRGGETLRPYREEILTRYPDGADLADAALGGGEEGPPAEELPALEVAVVHGDVRFATAPIMVGHYEDDDIFSTEKVLDETLGGELSRRLHLGLYPGPQGSAEYFPRGDESEAGALVIGLGRVGDIRPGNLERAVRLGALRYAVDRHDRLRRRTGGDGRGEGEAGESRGIPLGTVLIGSSEGSGLALEDSISSLLRGVLQANRELSEAQRSCVRIERLEIFELFEDRSVCAAHALRRLANDPHFSGGSQPIEAKTEVQWVAGGVSRLRCAGEDDWWRRLQITVAEQPAGKPPRERPLKFVSLSDRARAEVELVATQRRLVEGFLRRMVDEAQWSRSAATTLFELLVPNRFKDYAPDRRDLLLVLDEDAAAYPWELLEDAYGGRGEPLSIRAGMIRQLETGRFRHEVQHPSDSRALVIGDTVSDLPPLPGARREAEHVARILRQVDWEVDLLVAPEPEEILEKLFTRPYRLVHVAAHGLFDAEHPERGGLVLGEGAILTSGELQQMRNVPELFFVNCCHLGAVARNVREDARKGRLDIAARFGVQLISMGVRGVVSAGWVVDDSAAVTFAVNFYDSILHGGSFGEAVKRARRVTYSENRRVNTWGAYQCYGNPAFRLREPRFEGAYPQENAGTVSSEAVAPIEVVHELEGLASRAQAGDGAERLREKVEAVEDMLRHSHPEWLCRADVQAALGTALSEVAGLRLLRAFRGATLRQEDRAAPAPHGVGDPFEHAIGHFEEALLCDRGRAGLDVLQHLARLRGRRAIQRWRYSDLEVLPEGADVEERLVERRQEAVEEIEAILGQLDARPDLCRSVFGRCVLGETQKRRAQLESSDSLRLRLLIRGVEIFEGAYRRSQESRVSLGAYAVSGYCLLRLVGRLVSGAARGNVAREAMEYWNAVELERIPADLHAVVEGGAGGKTFWMLASSGDLSMLRLLHRAAVAQRAHPRPTLHGLRQALEEYAMEAEAPYREAFERGSARQVSTKFEELDWIVDLLGNGRIEPGLSLAGTEAAGIGDAAAAEMKPALCRELARSMVANLRRRLAASLASST